MTYNVFGWTLSLTQSITDFYLERCNASPVRLRCTLGTKLLPLLILT